MEKFDEKISNYKSLLKNIPDSLHVVEQDKKKFNLDLNDYKSIPERILNRENKEEIIDYFTNKIGFIIEKRKSMEWKTQKGLSEKEQADIGIEIKELVDAKEHEKNFLGVGKVGIVYETKYSSKFCIKYLINTNNKNKTLTKEYLMHKRVSDLFSNKENNHTFRCPQITHLVENAIDPAKTFFTMEKVNGFTAREINDNPNKLIEMFDGDKQKIGELISKLKDENYLNGVKKDLEFMHQNTGIIHGDIHLGNLMLSRDMNIFLIDFGNSIDTNTVEIRDSEDESIDNIKDQDISSAKNILEILRKSAESIFDKI